MFLKVGVPTWCWPDFIFRFYSNMNSYHWCLLNGVQFQVLCTQYCYLPCTHLPLYANSPLANLFCLIFLFLFFHSNILVKLQNVIISWKLTLYIYIYIYIYYDTCKNSLSLLLSFSCMHAHKCSSFLCLITTPPISAQRPLLLLS